MKRSPPAALAPRRPSWLATLSAELLVRLGIDLRSLGGARGVRQFVRFTTLFALSVILPAMLLSYFALSSISAEELQVDADLDRRAQALETSVVEEIEATFARFETQTLARLRDGQSPLANLAELSPYLRAAFRLDADGNLVAPFELPESVAREEPSTWYTARWTQGARAERAGDYEQALLAYGAAAEATNERGLAGEAEFAAARVLQKAGRTTEAEARYADVYADFANTRDQWGFRIGDLAALKRGEIALSREPDVGRAALEGLVEQLLSDRWTANRPGEAAVARRALALLEPYSDRDWLGRSNVRLTERSRQLFWTGELVDELESFTGQQVRTVGGFRYHPRPDASSLWATLPAEGSLYAFSFDYGQLIADLRESLQRSTRLDEDIFAQIMGVDERDPDGMLRRATLFPWATYHTIVVGLIAPDTLMAQKGQTRRTRLLVIALAVLMSILGVFASVRMVSSELEAARMKTDFAANVSHELRSPITQIRLKAESLQLDLVFDDADRQAHYDAIVHEAERLSRLVDNVLDFAAIERGAKKYILRAEDIEHIVGAAVGAAKSDLDAKGIVVDLELESALPVVWVDREAITQVLTNLLSNAVKYGGDGKWIGLRASLVDDGLAVSVTDRGIGVAPDELERLFDHFYRSHDPRVRRKKGTGIGLAIVRYIVEAHGGTITATSDPGAGTTFTFVLPLEPPDEAAT